MIWAGENRWNPRDALDEIERAGLADRVPQLSEQMTLALHPVSPEWLCDRLSLLWLMNGTGGSSPERAKAWLSETGRLLGDLPQDIVAKAIDDAVRSATVDFLPGVGTIRAIAEPVLQRRRVAARRLGLVANLMFEPSTAARRKPDASRAEPINIEDRLPPAEVDETNRLMERLGLRQRYRPDGSGYQIDGGNAVGTDRVQQKSGGNATSAAAGPRRKPTASDYRELMGEEAFAAWRASLQSDQPDDSIASGEEAP